MADWQDISAETQDLIDSALEDLRVSARKSSEKILTDIVDWMTAKSSGGSLENSLDNVASVSELNKIINDGFQEYGYLQKVNEYAKNFNTIYENNRLIQSDLNGIDIAKADLNKYVQQSIKDITGQLVGSGVDTNFIKPIQKIMTGNFVAGATIKNAEETLRTYILGNKETLGYLDRYVEQVALDTTKQFQGNLNQWVANEYNLDGVRYVGSIIKDSRWQCKRWAGKVIKQEDLKSEIAKAYSSGSGMIPGTTPDNFLSLRGGYRCRHDAYPVRITEDMTDELL